MALFCGIVFQMSNTEEENGEGGFKTGKSVEKRMEWSSRLLAAYPDKYPVIINRDPSGRVRVSRQKFIVPGESSILSFTAEVRHHVAGLKGTETLYCFLDDGTTPLPSTPIHTLYAKSRDEDGFLYLTYTLEDAYGQ